MILFQDRSEMGHPCSYFVIPHCTSFSPHAHTQLRYNTLDRCCILGSPIEFKYLIILTNKT